MDHFQEQEKVHQDYYEREKWWGERENDGGRRVFSLETSSWSSSFSFLSSFILNVQWLSSLMSLHFLMLFIFRFKKHNGFRWHEHEHNCPSRKKTKKQQQQRRLRRETGEQLRNLWCFF
jgi:hypothetical protein